MNPVSVIKLIKRRLLRPGVLKEIKRRGSAPPRLAVKPVSSVLPQVLCFSGTDNLEHMLQKFDSVWDFHYGELFQPGHRVLIKINLNTANLYPASVSPEMLSSLIGLLDKRGIRDIVVGDCSSIRTLPTKRELKKTEIRKAISGRARFVCFDRGPWISVPIEGEYLKQVTVPQIVLQADRIIALANLKTHRRAAITFGLKLGVGYMHPLERYALHDDHLQEKIAEINLAIQPDLTIIDGRKAFITGGPDQGRVESANTILCGTNQLAVDLEAFRLLYALKQQHGCEEDFTPDPFSITQLRHAREIGIGGKPWKGYHVVTLS